MRLSAPRRRVLAATLGALLVLLLVGDVAPRTALYLMYDLEVDTRTTTRAVDPEALVRVGGVDTRGVEKLTETTTSPARTDPADAETEDKAARVSAETTVRAGGETLAGVREEVSLERDSTFPVDQPTGVVGVEVPVAGFAARSGGFVREGLAGRFPVDTEKRSYPWFDPWLMAAPYLDYRGTAPADADEPEMTTFLLGGRVAGTALATTAERLGADAGQLTVTARAGDVFDPAQLAARGLSAARHVRLEPYYAVDREVRVEPQSGRVVDVAERVRVYLDTPGAEPEYADGTRPDEPVAAVRAPGGRQAVPQIDGTRRVVEDARTLVAAETRWDPASRAAARDAARTTIDTRRALAALAWVCRVLTVVAVVCGVRAWLRADRRR